jgi:hypothetical protein
MMDVLNADKVKKIIELIKEIDIDGETMQYILEKVGMDEQMYSQLLHKYEKV